MQKEKTKENSKDRGDLQPKCRRKKVKIQESGELGDISRYFTVEAIDEKQQCLLIHRNGFYIVTISPNHPAIGLGIKSVSFIVGKKDYSKIKLKGKKNKGGPQVRRETQICTISCADGSSHPIFSTIPGCILQINGRLKDEPLLLSTHTTSQGYVAIIKPTKAFIEEKQSAVL
mmetsp:Transcript_9222/g.12215  ORF Transcript_9222/g.12215 Transcript_9222/m.12215 type:complete len:173 (+) Transcript_9222:159-677(+)